MTQPSGKSTAASQTLVEKSNAPFFDVENADETEALLRQVIAEELRVEDRLDEEVRTLMREHMDRISRADVEYHEMFKVIKARLAKEREIIL